MSRLELKAKFLFNRVVAISQGSDFKVVFLEEDQRIYLSVDGFEDIELGIY